MASLEHPAAVTLQVPGATNGVAEADSEEGDKAFRKAGSASSFMDAMRSVSSALAMQVLDPALYKSASMIDIESRMQHWSALRRRLYWIEQHPAFDSAMGWVIIANVVVLLLEANASAEAYPERHSAEVLEWLNRIMLVIYTVEVTIRGFVWRRKLFHSKWNVLDLTIVFVGWMDEIYTLSVSGRTLTVTRVMPLVRVLRIMRLARAFKLLRFHPELYVMIVGFFGAMKAMLWGFVLIMLLIVFWSVICVEIINPVNQELKAEKPEAVSEFCEKAFSNVFNTGVMLFSSLVAGDSYGLCTWPIIEYNSWTFFVFALAVVSVTLGMMNLILGVIVDHAQSAREGDKEEKIRRKKEEEAEILNQWKEVLEQIDKDGDGRISYMEMMSGYEIPKIRDMLSLMGIDRADIHSMFKLIDKDGNGELDYHEFLSVFNKAQGQELRIYLMMMQLQNQSTLRAVNQMSKDVRRAIRGQPMMRSSSELSTTSTVGSLPSAASEPGSPLGRPPVGQADEAARPTAFADSLPGLSLEAEFQAMNARIEAHFAALSSSMERHTMRLERQTLALEGLQLTSGTLPQGKEPGPPQDLPDTADQPESLDRRVLAGLSLGGAAAGRRAGAGVRGGGPVRGAAGGSRECAPTPEPSAKR